MMTTAQRLDLMKIAADLAKSAGSVGPEALDHNVVRVFRALRSEIESGDSLDDASISDVKSAVDIASSLDGLIE